jgi:hypothetical protein
MLTVPPVMQILSNLKMSNCTTFAKCHSNFILQRIPVNRAFLLGNWNLHDICDLIYILLWCLFTLYDVNMLHCCHCKYTPISPTHYFTTNTKITIISTRGAATIEPIEPLWVLRWERQPCLRYWWGEEGPGSMSVWLLSIETIESLLLVERKRVKAERNNTVQYIAKSDEQLRHNLCSVSNIHITKLRNCWYVLLLELENLGICMWN